MRKAALCLLGLGLLCVLVGVAPSAVADEPTPEHDNPLVLTVDRVEHSVVPDRVGLEGSAMLFSSKDLAAISGAADLERARRDAAVDSMFLDGGSSARVPMAVDLLFSSQQYSVARRAAGAPASAAGQGPTLSPVVVLGSLIGVVGVASVLLRERTGKDSRG